MDVEMDGLAFDADSIQAKRITEDADYEGIRIRLDHFFQFPTDELVQRT